MSSPDLTRTETDAVLCVVETGRLSIGPVVERFEGEFARALDVPSAVGVSSGTAGLHLCVVAAGVADGDLAITSPFSFVASANCLLYERAIPIFVDVYPTTGNLDPGLVAEAAEALTRRSVGWRRWLPPSLRSEGQEAGPLKALLPVHTFGQPADMDSLTATAQRHGLLVIEDACEAVGAEYKGRKAGTLGDAAAFGFYPNKQMTTGEGGMIVTRRPDWDAVFRSLRNQGRDVFDAWLNHDRLGYNYRLDELSAALGLAQLTRLDELLAKRARVAGWYNDRLSGVEGIEVPWCVPETTRMSWFVYVIRLADPLDRDVVMRQLAERGVPSRPYFMPIHLQPLYRRRFGYQPGDFPTTESLGRRSLALPFSGVMSEEQVDYACRQLVSIVQRQLVVTR